MYTEYDRQYNLSIRGKTSRKKYECSPLGRETKKQEHRRVITDLIALLGAKCVICGYDNNILGLQIDHINGDGYLDKKKFNGAKLLAYRYYRRNPEEAKKKLQILCGTCHNIKTYNGYGFY